MNSTSNSLPVEPDDLRTRDGELSCADTLVRGLLQRTGLHPLILELTLACSIGEGNWISYGFDFALDSPISLEEIVKLANRSGAYRLRRSAKPGDVRWIRSEGEPSLHFQIVHDGDVLRCRGHVDAADPFTNPFGHLIYDYLPARGIGTHPSAPALLMKLQHKND